MSDRERLIAIAVGSIVALLFLLGGYRMIKGGFDAKYEILADRNEKLRLAKAINKKSKIDKTIVAEYQKKSLSHEPETAHLEFQHWLEKQVKEVGLQEHRFNFDNIPRTKKTLKQLSYLITGTGDINQITDLLYRIHSADTLHRVRSLDLQKYKDAVKMTARIDALSMPQIPTEEKVQVGTIDESKLTLSLEDYKNVISVRNLFSPANLPPTFDSLSRQTVEIGKSLSYKVKAEDPEGQGLAFELDEDAPEWLELSESGRLTGRPKELGTHKVKVYVTDKGIPAKESVDELTIRVIPERIVEDKPEPKDDFDESKLAVLTAIVQGIRDPTPQMCMYLRDKDESQYLQKGDKIEVGAWVGEVVSVNPDSNTVLLQTEDGEFELGLGQPLSEARRL